MSNLKKAVLYVTLIAGLATIYTFIESHIADQHQRTQVYELNEIAALEGLSMKWENRVRLDVVRQNLMRMWSTT